jgi:hypothetical protein
MRMMRLPLITLALLVAFPAMTGLFAQDSAPASVDALGDVSVNALVGWGGTAFPLGLSFAAEVTLWRFKVGAVGVHGGAMVDMAEFFLAGTGVAQNVLLTAHMSLSQDFEVYLGLGINVGLVPTGLGFAQTTGLMLRLTDYVSAQFAYIYMGSFKGYSLDAYSLGVYGVGLAAKLPR